MWCGAGAWSTLLKGGGRFEEGTVVERDRDQLKQFLATAHLAPQCGINMHLLYHVEEVLTSFCEMKAY